MAQPFKRSSSSSSFPNSSPSIRHGNTPLLHVSVSDYPPLSQGTNDFLELHFSETGVVLEGSELEESFSSQFYPDSDWQLPLGSSQTSHTDPNWEPGRRTGNSNQSQDIPIDPRLSSHAFDPPPDPASAENVNDMCLQAQTEPNQHVFLQPLQPPHSSRSSPSSRTKRSIRPNNNLGRAAKARGQQRSPGISVGGEKASFNTPASSFKDVTTEGHRPKRRRLGCDNADVPAPCSPDLPPRAELILRNWISVTPGQSPTADELMLLAGLTRQSFAGIENWFKENGNAPEVAQSIAQRNACDDEAPQSILISAQQDVECTCKSSTPEILCWRRPRDPNMPYSCTHRCGRNFAKRGGWERHERINWGQKLWKCPRCPKTFKRRDKLGTDRGHLNTLHNIEPTDEIMRNACQSGEALFRESCGFCGKDLQGWKTYINHVGGHFADETAEPRWHMSMWRRPWTDPTSTTSPGDDDDDDDDDDNDDGENGGNSYTGDDEPKTGGRDTENGHHPGGPKGPNSRGGRSGPYGDYGSRSTYSTGGRFYLGLNSTVAPKEGSLSNVDQSGWNTFHSRPKASTAKSKSSYCSDHIPQLLMHRSMLRKNSIAKFLDFYDPFEHILCSQEYVVSHWLGNLEIFIEDMQSILPNELWTHESSQLGLGSPLWKSTFPPISIGTAFLASWLPWHGDLRITIRMTVSLVWAKIARFRMSRLLLENRTSRMNHNSSPLRPSPFVLHASSFARFSNDMKRVSCSAQSLRGLSDFYEEHVVESEFESWNGVVGSAMSSLANGNANRTNLFVLYCLYVLLVGPPHQRPPIAELKPLALLRRASGHAVISRIQGNLGPAIDTSSEGVILPASAIGASSEYSSGNDVACVATLPTAYLKWNKQRDPDRPYSCTNKCGWSFRKKGNWIKHETINLSREKRTCAQCQLCFTCLEDYRDHFEQAHQHPANSFGEEVLRSYATVAFSERCGFCGHPCRSWKQWTDHVGAHFENRLDGGPWVMSRWIYPWVDKDDALQEAFGLYEEHDGSSDNDDDYEKGDPGDGDTKDGGSGVASSCSDSRGADSGPNSSSNPSSHRQETQRSEASQEFSLFTLPPMASTFSIPAEPDIIDTTFPGTTNPQGDHDLDQQSTVEATPPLAAHDTYDGGSQAPFTANPLIQGSDLFEEPADMLPDPINTVSASTSPASNVKDNQDNHTTLSSYKTPSFNAHEPLDVLSHLEISLISLPLPSSIRYGPLYLNTDTAAILRSLEEGIDYPGFSPVDNMLWGNRLSQLRSHWTCENSYALSGKDYLMRLIALSRGYWDGLCSVALWSELAMR